MLQVFIQEGIFIRPVYICSLPFEPSIIVCLSLPISHRLASLAADKVCACMGRLFNPLLQSIGLGLQRISFIGLIREKERGSEW